MMSGNVFCVWDGLSGRDGVTAPVASVNSKCSFSRLWTCRCDARHLRVCLIMVPRGLWKTLLPLNDAIRHSMSHLEPNRCSSSQLINLSTKMLSNSQLFKMYPPAVGGTHMAINLPEQSSIPTGIYPWQYMLNQATYNSGIYTPTYGSFQWNVQQVCKLVGVYIELRYILHYNYSC